MPAPDYDYVRDFLASFDATRMLEQLIAYPVTIAGVRVVVLGRGLTAESGIEDNHDSVPLAVIVTDELAAVMDLTEVRS